MIIVPHLQITTNESHLFNRAISSGGGILAGKFFYFMGFRMSKMRGLLEVLSFVNPWNLVHGFMIRSLIYFYLLFFPKFIS